MASDTLFGVLLVVCGTFATALGNHLVHRSHLGKKGQTRAIFILGNVLIIVVGTLFGLAAFAYAPQSLVAPLGGLTIVWNAFLASLPAFGGIKLSSRDVWATVACLMGSAALVFFGPRRDPAAVDPQTVFSQWSFATFFFLSLAGALSLDGLSDSQSASKDARRMACGAVGGVVGGLSNVFSKSAVVSGVPSSPAQFIVLALAALCALLQLMALNRALARFPPFVIVPVYQVSLLLAATASGIITFDQCALSRLPHFANTQTQAPNFWTRHWGKTPGLRAAWDCAWPAF